MTNEFEAFVVQQMLDIASGAGEKIVEANDLRPFGQQAFAKVRAQKTGAAGHQNPLLEMHQPRSSLSKSDLQLRVKINGTNCHADFQVKAMWSQPAAGWQGLSKNEKT